jgi:hypothetical protein
VGSHHLIFLIMRSVQKISSFILLITVLVLLSCQKEMPCEGCAEKNKPPIAVAGPDQAITLPIDSVSLDGRSSSDPDGSISKYLWTKISGPVSFNMIKPIDSLTKVKALVIGTYLFELKVTDNGGLSAKDTMQVFVNSTTNHPPIANAGADQAITIPTNTVNLDGSGSTDPENNITGYIWSKISGPSSFTISNMNAVQTQVANLVQGIYQFELKVTDNSGLNAKDTMLVIVNSTTDPPPVINCSADNLTWTLADNGMMALINPGAIAGTLDCAGFGAEFLIPSHYIVWVQYEGSSNWIHLDYVFRDAIYSAAQNIFLSSTIYNDPTGNDGPVSVPVVYAKPNSGIDFTKKVTVINVL